MLVLVITLGLAIAVGRLYYAQSELQKVADLSALNAARLVGGCRGPVSDLDTAVVASINDTIAANDSDGLMSIAPDAPVLGSVAFPSDRRVFDSSLAAADTRPNAVRVVLTRPAPTTLVSLFTAGGQLKAAAAAANPVRAQIRASGQLANVSPAILSALLGGTGVSVLDPSGLANATVNLGALATELGVATPEQLLGTPVALDAALEALGDLTSGTASTILSNLAQTVDNQSVVLGNVLSVVGPVGEDLAVNVGTLTSALATLAAFSRDEPIELPITLGVPGIADVEVFVRLLPPPGDATQIAIGPPGKNDQGAYYTQVHSAQALVQINIGLLEIGSYSLSDLTLFIELGRANAGLKAIECAHAGQPEHHVTLQVSSAAARIGIGKVSDLHGNTPSAHPTPSTLLDLGLVKITAATNPPISVGGADSQALEFSGPFPSAAPLQPQTKHILGADDSTLLFDALTSVGNNLDVNVKLPLGLNLPAGAVLDSIITPVTALLKPVLAPLLDSVFKALGLSLGAGEATVVWVNTGQPFLIGTGLPTAAGASNQP